MDKQLVLAVAGSGKTSHIVSTLDAGKRTLLLTYTDNNYENLRHKVVKRFGSIPENVSIQTYFTFLNSFCYRPYLAMEVSSRGICFERPSQFSSRQPLTSNARYLDSARRVYHSRMSKLLDVRGCMPELLARVRRYYDAIYIDEVQDFGGHDFNFILALCGADVSVLLVGDFFQHTFSTSVDGNVNCDLHSDYGRYKNRFEAVGIMPNEVLLEKSHRCSKEICEFISDGMGIKIESQASHSSKIVVVEQQYEIERLHACTKTVKLFFKEHGLYNCFSDNWGASKGADHYQDVLVVLNESSWKAYQKGACKNLAPLSRNKLYVACSRARGDLYLAPESSFKRFLATG